LYFGVPFYVDAKKSEGIPQGTIHLKQVQDVVDMMEIEENETVNARSNVILGQC